MTTLELQGGWNILKGSLQQKWAVLTDDYLQLAEGRQVKLLGRIQKRTGETRVALDASIQEYGAAHTALFPVR